MATKFCEIEAPDVPVPVSQLIAGTKLPCDMFIRENNELKVFFNKDVLYTSISQDILKEKGISEVYIFRMDTLGFDSYLSSNRSLNLASNVNEAASLQSGLLAFFRPFCNF